MTAVTPQDLNTLLVGALGTVLGAVGAAYGATAALRTRVDQHGDRLLRIETRVGLTPDGALTGNGLIGRVVKLEATLDDGG